LPPFATGLRTNASFVFFRVLDLPADTGPLGTMQRPVTALRSIAVDPDHIPLGAPVWVEWQGNACLMIAQDTGSAIKGPARGDIFFGTGTKAGLQAGALKAAGRLTVLLPKAIRP
jgi:membrane-bound lytic murein transglycosylase A